MFGLKQTSIWALMTPSSHGAGIRNDDLSPPWQSTIGFDRLSDFAEIAQRTAADSYSKG
jgi:hypothetical protein